MAAPGTPEFYTEVVRHAVTFEAVEAAERNYFTARDAEPDHRWGEEQEAAFGEACDALQKTYDAAGTPEFDRIQL